MIPTTSMSVVNPKPDDRAVIVSTDGHVSPLLTDLREYCPREFLDDFDDFAQFRDVIRDMLLHQVREMPGGSYQEIIDTLDAAYHTALAPRLPEMDRDGVAMEMLFHGSTNFEPMPFGATFAGHRVEGSELAVEGQRIFNRWLADQMSIAPERFFALAHVPIWDIDTAVGEIAWAAEHGFRGVNFPAPRRELIRYDNPAWEPFWAACEEHGMLLASHSGGAVELEDLNEFWYFQFEGAGAGSSNRRSLYRLIFGGVFERHPNLQVMYTEQPGNWWTETFREYDSVHGHYPQLKDPDRWYYCPRLPSEYAASNVLIGASAIAPFEARQAIEDGYTKNVCWGRDFPHPEGTWKPHDGEAEPVTRLQLRFAFSDIDAAAVSDMVGANVVRACALDGDLLSKVAEQIEAPTYAELATPIDAIPENHGVFAFRSYSLWA
jgi:predicted TIM-barrel fold metal-dependent hydrolase